MNDRYKEEKSTTEKVREIQVEIRAELDRRETHTGRAVTRGELNDLISEILQRDTRGLGSNEPLFKNLCKQFLPRLRKKVKKVVVAPCRYCAIRSQSHLPTPN